MTNYIGKRVKHRFIGEGTVISIDKEKRRMKVDFDGDLREFRYPEAMEKYFTLVPPKPEESDQFKKSDETQKLQNTDEAGIEPKQPEHDDLKKDLTTKEDTGDAAKAIVSIEPTEVEIEQKQPVVSVKKKKLKKWWLFPIVAVGVIAIAAAPLINKTLRREQLYHRFLENRNAIQIEQLGYRDTYSLWNAEQSNDINTLLGGGYICHRDDYTIIQTQNCKDGTAIYKNDKSFATISDSISYINLRDNVLFYRKNSDRGIYSYDISKKNERLLVAAQAGEVQVSDGKLYYVDLSDNYCLMATDIEGKNQFNVIQTAVREFAVIGKQILYLDSQYNLRLMDMESSEDTILVDAVERFFISKAIFIERGNHIYQIPTDALQRVKLFFSPESRDNELNLCGAYDGGIYYQENGMLYRFDGAESNKIVEEKHLLYTSLGSFDNKVQYVTLDGET